MIDATAYYNQIQTLKRQLSGWRIVQYFKGYSAGFHRLAPPSFRNEFFDMGYLAGERDRQLSFEQPAKSSATDD